MLTLHPQRQCIRNLRVVLEAAGSSLDDVVEVNMFLSDMKDFAQMNEVYGEYWGKVKPSRTWVAVSSVSHHVLLLTSGVLCRCVAVKTLSEHTDVDIKCVGLVTAKSRL
jgi:enamine deaminase RidA (YjgF/YER057c/UK114 family)